MISTGVLLFIYFRQAHRPS